MYMVPKGLLLIAAIFHVSVLRCFIEPRMKDSLFPGIALVERIERKPQMTMAPTIYKTVVGDKLVVV